MVIPDVITLRFLIEVTTLVSCDCGTHGCTAKEYHWTTGDGVKVDQLRPGDVYFTVSHADQYVCAWDNCDGRHLICRCPDITPAGYPWVIDGRASNCTMKEDRTHRCWVRHGDPAKGELHVDKNGHTCAAGGGSIQVDGGYHGFLHNFELRKA